MWIHVLNRKKYNPELKDLLMGRAASPIMNGWTNALALSVL